MSGPAGRNGSAPYAMCVPEQHGKRAPGSRGGLQTEDAARAACTRLAASHPDRTTHQWLPRRVRDRWQVIKIAIPPPLEDLTAETQADQRPPVADDPRVAQVKNCGPYGAPI